MKKILFILMLWFVQFSAFTQYKVTGTVKNLSGETLPGATVIILNTKYATATDASGAFSFQLPTGSYSIQVTYVGYVKLSHNFSVLDKDEVLTLTMQLDHVEMEGLEVISTRAGTNSAMAVTEVDKKTIEQINLGQDVPYLLDQTPSVVVTSDAGNGIGYSGIRIRGSDPTRVNVTVNGIPVNDAESQGVYWVDFPDLASSMNSIQVQRGLGTSSNGAGAFGGTLNIQTSNDNVSPYAQLSNSYGSFNSHKHTLSTGTGRISNKNIGNSYVSVDTRLSWIASDGFIDRAFSDLKSFYVSAEYHQKNSNLRLVVFSGKEKTYQAWGGVPKEYLDSNRTYNPYTYKNETDNYLQSNYQLLYNFKCSEKLKGNVSLHYTKGAGYYEQYKSGEYFSNYGLENVIIGTDTIVSTDLIRQLWLDNDFYGTVYTLNYTPNGKLNFIFGGGWNKYIGRHFGEIIWAQYAMNSNINQRYYDDEAVKMDFNNFLKANYWISKKINAFADLQVRNINYNFNGFDRDLNFVNQDANYVFFNPKAGITAYLPKNQIVFVSFGRGNKEPNRDDFVASSENTRPKAEQLNDLEIGYKYSSLNFAASVNFYDMEYKNQLVLTGKINDVGAYTRQNIANSYRRGVEIELGYKWKNWSVGMNATFSQNKILDYVEYIDNWDTWGQDSIIYNETDISFSPSLIAGGRIGYSKKWSSGRIYKLRVARKDIHTNEFSVSILPKYVGDQYIDNTSSSDRMLEAYLVTDGLISFKRSKEYSGKFISLNFMLRNMFNELYSSNAWTYRYSTGGQFYSLDGYYPQAGINYMIGLTLGF